MRLLDDFYKIEKQNTEGSITSFHLFLNEKHQIYEVHFKENPITPGACLIQICQELTEIIFENEHPFLSKLKSVKFLQTIDPRVHKEILCRLDSKKNEGDINATASFLGLNGEVFAKLSLIFKLL